MTTDRALSMAVLLYLGWGDSKTPTARPEALVGYFGPELGPQLEQRVKQIAEQFFVTVPWSDERLPEAATRVQAELREQCPELTSDAIEAIGWWYAWVSR